MVLQAAGGALAQVGVQAVVENLGNFGKAFSSMNNMMDGFGNKASLLSRAFEPVNKVLGAFFESMRRIGEFVIAGIILKGLDAIVDRLKQMAGEAISAAMEFQGLQIRLENFLATDIMKAGGAASMTEALEMAAPLAKELFLWVQKIAITTPFDSQEVADAFTMAKAWGFATDEAKALTLQVIDFTAGMGFSGQEMDRVVKGLAQMKSLGRVAGGELLQLANAGVPVADIMTAIREELGLTVDQFEALRMKGGVSAEMFFEQWDKLVTTRFAGSAERMSRTIGGVLGNIKDLVSGILGFNVIKPVLDVVGEKLASFFDALSTGENLERLLSITEQLGAALSGIAELFLGTLPDPDVFATKILDFVEKFKNAMVGIKPIIDEMIQGNVGPGSGVSAILQVLGINATTAGDIGSFVDKLIAFKDTLFEIIDTFKNEGFMAGLGAMGVPEPILEFFKLLGEAWGNLVKFWDEEGDDIKAVLKDVMKAIADAVGVGEIDPNKTSLLEVVGALIETLFGLLVEKGPGIVSTIQTIGRVITDDFIPAFYEVSDWIVENQDLVFAFISAFVIGLKSLEVIGRIASIAVLGIGAALVTGLGAAIAGGASVVAYLVTLKQKIFYALGVGKSGNDFGSWRSIADNLWDSFRRSFVQGIINTWDWVSPWLSWFVAMVKWIFKSASPSKVFADIGSSLMEGMAMGIKEMQKLPELAMKTAVTHIIQPAMSPLQTGAMRNQSVTNNFSMNINTQANAEPIISDFRMMQSLASGGF